MMKQVLTIGFAAFYFLVSTGMYVDIHSCQGEVKSVTILAEIGTNCCETDLKDICCSGTQPVDDCCDEEQVFLHLPLDVLPAKVQQKSEKKHSPTDGQVIAVASNLVSPAQQSEPDGIKRDTGPALAFQQPAWLLNCALVFYG